MSMQVKPTGQLQVTKKSSISKPQSSATANKEPASQLGSIVPHSADQARKSQRYHNGTLDPQYSRAVDTLNPTDVVPAHRSFPGLAN